MKDKRGDQLGSYCSTTGKCGSSGSDERQSNSRQISKAKPIGFPDGLDAWCEIMNPGLQGLGAEQLEGWRCLTLR